MRHPRPLTERELTLINSYINCKLELSPRTFYAKWDVDYEVIANICSRSPSTVRRWFRRGCNYRSPSKCDLQHLALMDFLLEHFEQIPSEIFHLLCPLSRIF
ncbi:helix-turn-helix domain-containing protein [Calothrix sp. FACHB-156]|nr:helix-turn-helix domain-containing protein [Calothrix sp. FACHB-156]